MDRPTAQSPLLPPPLGEPSGHANQHPQQCILHLDVLELILQEHRNDPFTLASSALASQSLLQIARKFLYRSVSLDYCENPYGHEQQRKLRLSLARNFHLCGSSANAGKGKGDGDDETSVLDAILRELVRLESLHLIGNGIASPNLRVPDESLRVAESEEGDTGEHISVGRGLCVVLYGVEAPRADFGWGACRPLEFAPFLCVHFGVRVRFYDDGSGRVIDIIDDFFVSVRITIIKFFPFFVFVFYSCPYAFFCNLSELGLFSLRAIIIVDFPKFSFSYVSQTEKSPYRHAAVRLGFKVDTGTVNVYCDCRGQQEGISDRDSRREMVGQGITEDEDEGVDDQDSEDEEDENDDKHSEPPHTSSRLDFSKLKQIHVYVWNPNDADGIWTILHSARRSLERLTLRYFQYTEDHLPYHLGFDNLQSLVRPSQISLVTQA
ncbi:hypothetical protein EST38_g8358 [Candolleomyces aberdarensis]|uniref:Uncharacterized protein n=1 Tax=Candolleomyces aberdarensis TaxID=2316362 RepID=A0A4Q2DFK2_9AGAR|nr:hypothetical protein EST38_g8358 [Candolleomyces aberdarensis]